MNKPKAIGTKAETAVARYLEGNGSPDAERRSLRGRHDAGDITGTPGVCWSVKGGNAARDASDLDIERWLVALETQRLNARADIGVLVLQRRGVGPANAGRWWAVMDAATLFRLHGGEVLGMLGLVYTAGMPVRLHLADAVHLLRAAGYGHPFDAVDVST